MYIYIYILKITNNLTVLPDQHTR